jgi:hypothetical protein
MPPAKYIMMLIRILWAAMRSVLLTLGRMAAEMLWKTWKLTDKYRYIFLSFHDQEG